MIRKFALVAATSALFLVGCGGGGDINITPSTVDNSVNNSNNTTTGGGGGTGTTNPCASYLTSGGQTRQGTFDGTNCTYAASFVDSINPLMVDVDIPNIGDGVHLFQGSLFVGAAANTDAELAALNITKGGDGPTLTIEAGVTMAWPDKSKFMVINRGAQINAVGTADAPITLTSLSDVNGDLADNQEAVSEWGGLVINGFGVNNKCSYTGTRGVNLALAAPCHIASEGSAGVDENFHGGDNDDDSSGRMEFFIVKHPGAEVGNGDELNGITFSAVGRNTIVRNIQTYSTFDDGIEMFGGAVNVTNYAGVYVRDDSVDVDDGWMGTVDTALIIQSELDGNHCIESDGLGSFSSLDDATIEDFIARGLHTQGVMNNMTCIIGASSSATGTHGQSAGWHIREGMVWEINDSMIVASFNAASTENVNYCLRIDNRSRQAAQDGDIEFNSVVFACEDRTNGGTLPNGTTIEAFAESEDAIFATIVGAVNPTATADTQLILLEGSPPIFSVPASQMVVNDAALPFAPTAGDFIGALSLATGNPFAGWAYGIFEDNRVQPLWFELE